MADLRHILIMRLRRAFSGNKRVDESFIEDVAQDGLLSILGSLEKFEGRSLFTTWATTITIRIALTQMRRRRWKDVSLDEFMANQPAASPHSSQSVGVEETELRKQLLQKMHEVISEQLTEKQRVALLAELKGMPQEEIGRRTGSNRNAIYKLTHDARKKVKKGMLDAGYSAEDLVLFKGTSK